MFKYIPLLKNFLIENKGEEKKGSVSSYSQKLRIARSSSSQSSCKMRLGTHFSQCRAVQTLLVMFQLTVLNTLHLRFHDKKIRGLLIIAYISLLCKYSDNLTAMISLLICIKSLIIIFKWQSLFKVISSFARTIRRPISLQLNVKESTKLQLDM